MELGGKVMRNKNRLGKLGHRKSEELNEGWSKEGKRKEGKGESVNTGYGEMQNKGRGGGRREGTRGREMELKKGIKSTIVSIISIYVFSSA